MNPSDVDPSPHEESHLISRCRENPTAFGAIYDRHFDAIFQYLLYKTANVADAEDLTAQVFLKAFRAIGTYRPRGKPLLAWLYRIAKNELNSFFRNGKRPTEAATPHLSDALPDPSQDLEAELQRAESHVLRHRQFLQVHQCLKDLKPIDQDLIVMRFFQDRPYAEMAAILGKKPGTLMTRTSRAIKRLQTIMESRGFSHETLERHAQEPAKA